jgi:predicted RNase H-like nuclease (RuvC/YqgF family)
VLAKTSLGQDLAGERARIDALQAAYDAAIKEAKRLLSVSEGKAQEEQEWAQQISALSDENAALTETVRATQEELRNKARTTAAAQERAVDAEGQSRVKQARVEALERKLEEATAEVRALTAAVNTLAATAGR